MTPLFTTPGPRWFNIPAHRPFLDDLAQGVQAALSPRGPAALADATILVPNRRAARALAQSFVKATGGRALVLPQIRALGDLDEGKPPFEPGDIALDLPPAIEPWRRRFELARIAAAHGPALGRDLDAAAALELGDALGHFFDSLEIEEVSQGSRDSLDTLVEGDLAEHWQISSGFLKLAVRDWPARLAELGLMDITARRVALLKGLEESWHDRSPDHPVIAAGSTGSAPATARLLDRVARLDQGCVVLPGLDTDLSDEAWDQITGPAADQHPQGALKRLLETAGVDRESVQPWLTGAQARGRLRRRVINDALRPAEATADWLDEIGELRKIPAQMDPIAEGLSGLTLLAAEAEEDTAAIAAVLMREVLEQPGKTCALITPDQNLARRVSARLSRWDITVDSSSGRPLADHPAGVLVSLAARGLADPRDPVTLLALLKHPLVRLGRDPDVLAAGRAVLESAGLRGPRPKAPDVLLAKLDKFPQAKTLAADLIAILRAPNDAADVAGCARAVAEAVESLGRGAADEPGPVWAGAAGECASALLAALIQDGTLLGAIAPGGFAQLIDRLLAKESVRATGAVHPRLQILGALEGRLIQADCLILAGLEEGVWPPPAPTDPFLSRPMRKTLGLPSPERRIGLSAHDFAQAACAPEVVLIHTERRNGQPTVKSRWLWRLETLARGAGLKLAGRPELVAWARGLDAVEKAEPAPPPAPTPPVAARPRRMAVTRIEALTRDPYGVWARDILKLYPLPPPDEQVDARLRGSAIHEAFEQFARQFPDALPTDAAEQFKTLYLTALVDAGLPRASLPREEALAHEAAQWVAEWEAGRREQSPRLVVEEKGEIALHLPGGDFILTATTDRIEVLDGRAHVLDFKTGSPPSGKMVKTGFSPQLTLTAAILERGGFPGVGPVTPDQLVYVGVTGRKPAGTETVLFEGAESQAQADAALDGLIKLIARYDDPAEPYCSRIAPQFVHAYAGDYDHLARVFEWSTAGDDGEAG